MRVDVGYDPEARRLEEFPRDERPQVLKPGTLKKITGHIHNIAENHKQEQRVYEIAMAQAKFDRKNHRECDVIEIFAGAATITRRCHKWGFRAGEPGDILYGWNFLKKDQRRNSESTCRGLGRSSW